MLFYNCSSLRLSLILPPALPTHPSPGLAPHPRCPACRFIHKHHHNQHSPTRGNLDAVTRARTHASARANACRTHGCMRARTRARALGDASTRRDRREADPGGRARSRRANMRRSRPYRRSSTEGEGGAFSFRARRTRAAGPGADAAQPRRVPRGREKSSRPVQSPCTEGAWIPQRGASASRRNPSRPWLRELRNPFRGSFETLSLRVPTLSAVSKPFFGELGFPATRRSRGASR